MVEGPWTSQLPLPLGYIFQRGIETSLQFLFDTLPDLVMGAVPLKIQEYIADMMEVCRIADSEVGD